MMLGVGICLEDSIFLEGDAFLEKVLYRCRFGFLPGTSRKTAAGIALGSLVCS